MKQKILWLLMLIVCFGCSETEDPSEKDPETKVELDEESKEIVEKYKDQRMLIGKWKNDHITKRTSFKLVSDGRCIPYNVTSLDEGIWEYDKVSQILTTTCGDWTLRVNLLAMDEWTGLATGASYPFKREKWVDPNDELLIGTWINKDTDESLTFMAGQKYIFKSSVGEMSGTYEVETSNKRGEKNEFVKTLTLSGNPNIGLEVEYLDGCYLGLALGGEKERNTFLLVGDYVYSDFVEPEKEVDTGSNDITYRPFEGDQIEKIVDSFNNTILSYKYDKFGRISEYCNRWQYKYDAEKVTVTEKDVDVPTKITGYWGKNGYITKFDISASNKTITYHCEYNDEGFLIEVESLPLSIYEYRYSENNSLSYDYDRYRECIYLNSGTYSNISNLDLNQLLYFSLDTTQNIWHSIFAQFGFLGNRLPYLFEKLEVRYKDTGKDCGLGYRYGHYTDGDGRIEEIGWNKGVLYQHQCQYWVYYKK